MPLSYEYWTTSTGSSQRNSSHFKFLPNLSPTELIPFNDLHNMTSIPPSKHIHTVCSAPITRLSSLACWVCTLPSTHPSQCTPLSRCGSLLTDQRAPAAPHQRGQQPWGWATTQDVFASNDFFQKPSQKHLDLHTLALASITEPARYAILINHLSRYPLLSHLYNT